MCLIPAFGLFFKQFQLSSTENLLDHKEIIKMNQLQVTQIMVVVHRMLNTMLDYFS
jgi:hypothetical protein